MSESDGYILRIATEQWARHVFDMAIYYTSLSRKWKSGQIVLFMRKTDQGDAIVGYGVIESVCDADQLPDEERRECTEGRWKRALQFRYVRELEKALPIKETFLRDSKLRGRYFHGLRLTKEQLDSFHQIARI